MWSPAERITQSVVKSHMETSRYSAEELKRLAWTMYSQEETRSYQTKVRKDHRIASRIAGNGIW